MEEADDGRLWESQRVMGGSSTVPSSSEQQAGCMGTAHTLPTEEKSSLLGPALGKDHLKDF